MIADVLLVGCLGFFAGWLSGIIGTGASLILLPVLVPMVGVVNAMPVMAIAGLMANLTRILIWRTDIDWRAALTFALPGIPVAYWSASLLIRIPTGWAELLLGGFILLLVPARRILDGRMRVGALQLMIAGALIGFLTGMFLSTGPLSVPIFLSYGLTGGAFISTEATAALLIQFAKLTSFQQVGVLPRDVVTQGLAVGALLLAGTAFSRPFVIRINERCFRLIMDTVTAGSSLLLVAAGLTVLC